MTTATSEVTARSVALPRAFAAFPAWNNAISTKSVNGCTYVSIVAEHGRVVVLRVAADGHEPTLSLVVHAILPPPIDSSSSSVCHAGTSDGAYVAVVQNHTLTFHSTSSASQHSFQLRCSASSIDMMTTTSSSGSYYLVAAATMLGVHLYAFQVPFDDSSEPTTIVQPIAIELSDVAVSCVQFAPCGKAVAVGTADGRMVIFEILTGASHAVASFGSALFRHVSSTPRVTSIAFTRDSFRVVFATRKGNSHVLQRDELGSWSPAPQFDALAKNNPDSTIGATLACWWGNDNLLVICSRLRPSCVEVFDALSGDCLHTIMLERQLPQESLDHQITGICAVPSAHTSSIHLMLFDTTAVLTTLQWPFADLMLVM